MSSFCLVLRVVLLLLAAEVRKLFHLLAPLITIRPSLQKEHRHLILLVGAVFDQLSLHGRCHWLHFDSLRVSYLFSLISSLRVPTKVCSQRALCQAASISHLFSAEATPHQGAAVKTEHLDVNVKVALWSAATRRVSDGFSRRPPAAPHHLQSPARRA